MIPSQLLDPYGTSSGLWLLNGVVWAEGDENGCQFSGARVGEKEKGQKKNAESGHVANKHQNRNKRRMSPHRDA